MVTIVSGLFFYIPVKKTQEFNRDYQNFLDILLTSFLIRVLKQGFYLISYMYVFMVSKITQLQLYALLILQMFFVFVIESQIIRYQ